MSDHKNYIITLNETASDAEASSVKQKISEFGGKVGDSFSLIKGFTAQFPAVHADSFKNLAGVLHVEEDKEVKIQ